MRFNLDEKEYASLQIAKVKEMEEKQAEVEDTFFLTSVGHGPRSKGDMREPSASHTNRRPITETTRNPESSQRMHTADHPSQRRLSHKPNEGSFGLLRNADETANIDTEELSEALPFNQKKKNFKRFKGDNRDGYHDKKLADENANSVSKYRQRVDKYNKLVNKKLPKVGFVNEQDLLNYFCENFLIDKIPDDYEGYMQKVIDKLRRIQDTQQFDPHNSLYGALRKLALSVRNEIAYRRKNNKVLAGYRDMDENEDDNKMHYYKRHKRFDENIAEKYFLYKKIKDWATKSGLKLNEKLKRNLDCLGDRLFKYGEFFDKVKKINDGVGDLRREIFEDKKQTTMCEVQINSELAFSEKLLNRYQDDTERIIMDIDRLLNPDFY